MKRSENKQQVTLTDWAIVFYPSIYDAIEHPETVFAKHHCGRPIALFGMAKDDPRHNGETGAFADGHRLITSPIIEIVNGKYHTFNTIYVLDEDNINKDYKKWCEEHQYEQVPNENPNNIIIRHICENCGWEQILSAEEGYKQGWDYPPKMGMYKIISPRTCGLCNIETTLWWEITCNKTPIDQLSERHWQTLKRILSEPESILQ